VVVGVGVSAWHRRKDAFVGADVVARRGDGGATVTVKVWVDVESTQGKVKKKKEEKRGATSSGERASKQASSRKNKK
jgi:hypothetical protein